MLRRRFRHGEAFTSLNEALGWILAENDVYYRHKFMSHKWMRNWSITQLQIAVSGINLFKAEDVTDYYTQRGQNGTL